MLASPAVGWSLASLDDHGGTLSVPFDAHRFKIGRDELASTGAQELKFVSKEQCALTAREHDLLEVESLGRNPIGVRLGNADWQQLTAGAATTLAPGDLITFDWKQRAGTVFAICKGDDRGKSVACSARWLWQNGPGSWAEFSPSLCVQLERLHSFGAVRCEIDEHRHVDFLARGKRK